MRRIKIAATLVSSLFILFTTLKVAFALDVSGPISSDTVWPSAEVVRVTGNVTVNPGIRLVIEPGTIVKFNPGTRLYVDEGILTARGDENNKIIFTSFRDDEFGGDTNGDGVSAGEPGDWFRIYFDNAFPCPDLPCEAGQGGTELKHCVIRYAGTGVYLNHSDVSLISNEISSSQEYGIRISHGSPVVAGNFVSSNGADGLYVESASPSINGNTFADNAGWGINFFNATATPVISGNTIIGNLRSIKVPASAVPDTGDGNTLSPNRIGGVWIIGGTRGVDLHLERVHPGQDIEISSYCVAGTLNMAVGATMTVDPGVVVKFDLGAQLTINGALDAQGTADLPVVFTSYRDDRYGGDMNADGYATSPAAGDWGGIYFTTSADDAVCVLDHGVVAFGGNSNSGQIYAASTDLEIANSTIHGSSSNGFRSYNSSLTLAGVDFYGNAGHGISLESSGSAALSGCRMFANFGHGVQVAGSASASIANSEMFGNTGDGLNSSSSGTVTAIDNWWGAADGPSGDASGSGDQIVGTATYEPFLATGTAFSYFDAGPDTSEGPIAGPVVVQGTDTTEFGGSPTTRMLYDLERVSLAYAGLGADSRYDLFATYYGDDTSGVGGNIQSLTDGEGFYIHGGLATPSTAPVQYRYALSPATHDDGTLRLEFVRESGYRAVVSQVWLVKRAADGDIQDPVSSIATPSAGSHLRGIYAAVEGTSGDGPEAAYRVWKWASKMVPASTGVRPASKGTTADGDTTGHFLPMEATRCIRGHGIATETWRRLASG